MRSPLFFVNSTLFLSSVTRVELSYRTDPLCTDFCKNPLWMSITGSEIEKELALSLLPFNSSRTPAPRQVSSLAIRQRRTLYAYLAYEVLQWPRFIDSIDQITASAMNADACTTQPQGFHNAFISPSSAAKDKGRILKRGEERDNSANHTPASLLT